MYKTLISLYLRLIRRLNSPARIIEFSIKKYAKNPFIIQPDSNSQLSFKEFDERIDKLAFFFTAIGLTSSDTIVFSSKNSFEYFEVRAACHKLGSVFLGLPPNLSIENIVYFLNKTKAKIFFHRQFRLIDLILVKKESCVKCCIDLDSSEYKEIFKKIKGEVSSLCNEKPCLSDIATFNVSSGTTQKTPKIIQLSNKNWIESLYGIINNADIQANKKSVFLCTVSFLTSGSTTFLPVILSGISNIIVHEVTSPQKLAGIINQYKVTRLYITPSRLLELLEWCKLNNEKLTSLENITIGTERMPALKLKEAIEFFGEKIYVGYGMVEALPPIAMLGPREYKNIGFISEVSPPKGEERPQVAEIGTVPKKQGQSPIHILDSVGRVSKGVNVKILEDGRIAVKSKTVSLGYLDNREENAKCFKDGWFYTNDYGFIDKKRYLHILGRKEEILRESPRRIFAKEIEDRVYELPFINRCACVVKNEKIVVFISLRYISEVSPPKREERPQITGTERSLFNIEGAKQKIKEKVKEIMLEAAKKEILRGVYTDPECNEGECAQDDQLSQDDIQIVIKESLLINYAGKLDRKNLSEY